MEDLLINSDTLILAKEKGFNEYSSQSILQKWLRDKHGLNVVIIPEYYKNGINWNVQIS
jgi:hypothetical protein